MSTVCVQSQPHAAHPHDLVLLSSGWQAGSSFHSCRASTPDCNLECCLPPLSGWLAESACILMALCDGHVTKLARPAGAFIVQGSTRTHQAPGLRAREVHQVRPYLLILMSAQFQYSCEVKGGQVAPVRQPVSRAQRSWCSGLSACRAGGCAAPLGLCHTSGRRPHSTSRPRLTSGYLSRRSPQ
jgi:hypothetical protein